MPIECSYLLASGQKCKAPAVRGSSLCRHHHPRKLADEPVPFEIPPIQDKSCILFAVTELLEAVCERRIKRSDAGTLLYGFQLASNLMTDIDKEANKAIADGTYYYRGPAEAESPMYPMQGFAEAGTKEFDKAAVEDADAFLAALQSTSVEQALEQLQSRHPAPATGLRTPPQSPSRRLPVPSDPDA